jgi:hypothetical protein
MAQEKTTRKKDPTLDLANRAHALRVRIDGDERRLAIAYPDEVEKLEQDLERNRDMLASLSLEVESALEETEQEARLALDDFLHYRSLNLKLKGHFRDPGIKDAVFTRCYLSIGTTTSGKSKVHEAVEVREVKAALLKALKVDPPEKAEPSGTQQRHEEKLKNQRAGKGYLTDDEITRKAQDPDGFRSGQGTRVIKPTPLAGSR